MKYSKNFERDYNFYLSNLDNFDFCGTLNPKYEAIPGGIIPAKQCFYLIQSQGQNKATYEPELLNKILLCQAGVNFQIKQWVEGMADGTLLLYEISQRLFNQRGNGLFERHDMDFKDINFGCPVLEWVNGEPVYYKDIETRYKCPEWVALAVLNQSKKIMGL